MGGFGTAGQVAAGVWHRLYARAVYLRDPKGTELVLVSCDLPFLPGALGNKVAELVGKQTPSLSREQILFCATRTPHGPGNFSTSAFTNTLESPRPGYDPVLFEFLVNRLSKAILAAQSSAEAAQLSYAEAPLGGISMNRSLRAFLHNPESQDILKENETLDLGGTVPCPPVDAYRAIDPTLAVVRAIRAQDPKHTIALLGFFAVRPSSLGPPLPVYDSDLFGVASTLIEQELARSQGTGEDGVAAFVNGAEGDLVTTAARQDREDLEALGGRLAQGVLALAGSPAPRPLQGNLSYSCASYQFPNSPEPLIGAAALGGTEDGRTMLYDLGWREYLRSGPRQAVAGQGTKRDPLDSLQFPAPTLGRAEQIQQVLPSIPDRAWIGVYRIGSDLLLATLPGEFTLAMGRRIRRALEAIPAAGVPRPKVLLVGMANEDAGSFTTPEEHDVQAASGASMAYGRDAATSILGFIVQRASPSPTEAPRKDPITFSYSPGPATYFGIETIRVGTGGTLLSGVPRESFVYRLKEVLWKRTECALEVRHPFVHWVSDDAPWPPPSGLLESPLPHVAIEIHKNGCWGPLVLRNILEDERGTRILSLAWGLPEGKTAWTMIWLAPRSELDAKDSFRFRLESAGKIVTSRPFMLGTLDQHEDAHVPMKSPGR